MLLRLKDLRIQQLLISKLMLLKFKLQQQKTTKVQMFNAQLDSILSQLETAEAYLSSLVQRVWNTLASSLVSPLLHNHKVLSNAHKEPNHQLLISRIHLMRNVISMLHLITLTSH